MSMKSFLFIARAARDPQLNNVLDAREVIEGEGRRIGRLHHSRKEMRGDLKACGTVPRCVVDQGVVVPHGCDGLRAAQAQVQEVR